MQGKDEKRPKGRGENKAKAGASGVLLNMLTVLAVTVAVLLGCVAAAGGSIIRSGLIPEGTSVDGINIGGLTEAEARRAVEESRNRELDKIFFEINCAGNVLTFNAEDLGVSYDVDSAMEGLGYHEDEQSSILTQGLNTVLSPKTPEQRSSTLIYDADAIRSTIINEISKYDKEPVNANAQFYKETGTFTYTKDVSGRIAKAEEAAQAVIDGLENGGPYTINVEHVTVGAQITESALSKNTVLVSEYSTVLTKNDNRNTNIRLMCEAVNGIIISAGETLSINELVGKRTEEKGFKSAPAIVDGNITEDIGGGICQLSGTLYNAALLANMDIVERKRHTYPSTYLPVGLDSTLNWNNKDLKIRNNTDYPIYISANMNLEEMLVTVKLYGQPLSEGVSIELAPEVIREIKPEGQKLELTPTLPAGVRKVVQAAQIGYEVKVYRNHLLNGEVVERELISHDTYNVREATILVGISDENKEGIDG